MSELQLRNELATQYKLNAIFQALEKIADKLDVDLTYVKDAFDVAEQFRNKRT